MSLLRNPRTACRSTGALIASAVLASTLVGTASAAPGPDDNELPFTATASTLGLVPDSATGCYTDPGAPRDVEIPVSGITQKITDVSVTMSLTHDWMGDMRATLIAPDGTSATIFGSTGVGSTPGLSTGCGDTTDLVGPYTFSDSGAGDWWATAAATASDAAMPTGVYRPTRLGDPTLPPEQTLITPTFAGVADPNGIWILRLVDASAASVADVTAASLSLTVDATAPSVAITSGPADGASVSQAPTYAFASNDPTATFQCRIDVDAFAPCTTPTTLPSTPGKFRFEVRAVDPSGNFTAPTATAARLYTLTAPPATTPPTTAMPIVPTTLACTKAKAQLTKAKAAFEKAKKALSKAKSTDKPKPVVKAKTKKVKQAKGKLTRAAKAKKKAC